ncbi:DNA replication and repair protein RecR [Marinospirillum celere]|uniref:Recombination protein RecR n=1 Tax=Marinospirillum celere TaxID=1122252 RepID=A0A1I1E3D8_9GAMM|nr:recombination mediator RecR [Marinospirillum celere]SFB81624.1 DNA replication and repair protein RecR [Marinospirillum celere]
MQFSPLIEEMIQALRCLPGVGPKSAQRMAMYLLERDRKGGETLANTLSRAMAEVGHCESCRTLTEEKLCRVCASGKRNHSVVCVVETPADMLALEQTGAYDGRYFVLLGHLSPLEGIGPDDLGFDELLQKLKDEPVEEVILATNPTLEGETTAQYLVELLAPLDVKVTHLAQGIPLGGELEYLDGGTLSRAFAGRRGFDQEASS